MICNAPIETVIDIALTFYGAGVPAQEVVHTEVYNTRTGRQHAATSVTRHVDTNESTLARLQSTNAFKEETLKPVKNVVNVLAVGLFGTSNVNWEIPVWIPVNFF